MRRNTFDRKPQANHREKRRDSYPSEHPYSQVPSGDAVRKHKHIYTSYTMEKDERNGRKLQIVECMVKGCKMKFTRDKVFKP